MKRNCSILLRSCFPVVLAVLSLPTLANHVPNPVITGSATPFNASFTAVNLFDPDREEYATRTQGAVSAPFTTNPNDGTWAEFDFATTVTLNQFVMVARANPFDIVGTSRLIVSTDPVFDNTDTIFTFNGTGFNGSGVIQNLNPVSGRYARWEVLSSIGTSLNLGARQMYFVNIPTGHVLLPAPVAINSSMPFSAAYAARFAVNGNAGDGENHEYASAGVGAAMFVDLDFGRSVPITGFDFWNRVVDRVTTYNLVFADTADFSAPIATLPFTASLNGNQINSGTFAAITARYVRFQATGAFGGNNTGMREIQFYGPAGQPPIITQHPQGGTRLVGDSFTFSVVAGGDTPRFYQWWKQTAPLGGATNATLTLTNLQVGDSGDYHVVVRNAFGTTTSDAATLMVVDPPVDITSNLRAWFRMDDGVFLTAADSSGNGNNGMLEGFVDDDSQWVAGRIEGGLRFNPAGGGVNEVVRVPDSGQLDFSSSPEFTLAAWVRASPVQEGGAAVVARGVGGGGEQYAVDIVGGTYRFFVRDAARNARVAHSPAHANATWQHVVAVYSRTLNRMKLYVNTAEVSSGAPFAGTLEASLHDVSIGARKNVGSANYDLNLDGVVDDVRIYARALTPRDVAALYAEAAPVGPTIVRQPQPAYAGVGDSARFTVVADGTVPLSYQWRKDGVAISGATNETLVVVNAQLSDDADYSVVVENSQGSVASADAHLTVVPFLDLRTAPVQASSIFNADYPARNAFDGLKLSTGPNTARWASAPSGAPHWIYVDLGRDMALRRVTLDFDPACARDFLLRYRTAADGPTTNPDDWQAIGGATGYSQGITQGIDGPDVFFDFLESRLQMPGNVASGAVGSIGTNIFVGRYLMLHITATEAGFGHVSVWEMQVDAISSEAIIQSILLNSSGARLTFSGIPKRNYQVQRAAVDEPWTTLETIAASNDGLGEYVDPSPPQPIGFYRLFSP